ncbi:Nuclear Hormone Receptor family [Caenorhabditis elegans]|nr:Nuclear Hormone Receptor family [Caenorhabditis elegans]SAP35578.1 Nuclear Hormone Receptor family [Caenorhabditis elegans]|eukprot:NP_001317818.1 Nuclear Hormone Receptor family [Caenorhabditis elegans]
MFFRRVEVDHITYNCKYWNTCYDGQEYVDANNVSTRCRACRYRRCIDLGMRYIAPGKPDLELVNQVDGKLNTLLQELVLMDARRSHKILNFYTSENPTLRQMVTRSKGSRMVLKKATQEVNIHEWSFLTIYVSVEMFLNLDFMQNIDNEDKIVLLREFSLKTLVLNSAMRAILNKTDRVMTPDGKDVYPDRLLQMFSLDFLNNIRSRLATRFRELKVSSEEHMLLNLILFCNSALHPLSDETKKTLSARQKVYSSALLQLCLSTYQQTGPSRFADLLSICHVVNKTVEDVTYLTSLFKLQMPFIEYKKLFVDVVHLI